MLPTRVAAPAAAQHRTATEPRPSVQEMGARSRFTERRSLNDVCGLDANAPIRLLRGQFIVDLYNSGNRLPRRQDVPEHGFWSAQITKRTVVVVVSYPWLSEAHPDPGGFHVAVLGQLLSVYTQYMRSIGLLIDGDVALFIDYSSLYQAERTEAEGEIFKSGLKCINLLYAHARTSVWCLTRLPDGVARPYHQRGWCRFEYDIASIVKTSRRFMDIGLISSEYLSSLTVDNFADVRSLVAAKRHPPQLPSEFEARLYETRDDGQFALTFTNGSTDRLFVVQKYHETFHELFVDVDRLEYDCLRWTDEEIVQLAKILPSCSRLRTLSLRSNCMTDDGARVLAAALPRAVGFVDLSGNDSLTWVFAEQRPFSARWLDLDKACRQQVSEWGKRATDDFRAYYALRC